MQVGCDFLRDGAAGEDEVVTGIGPTNPDMPITNTHLQNVHSSTFLYKESLPPPRPGVWGRRTHTPNDRIFAEAVN